MMSLTTPRSVEELLNYRLARLVAATSAPGVRLLEGRFGVTRRQWGLLGILAQHGPASPSELSKRAHLEPSKVSLHISDLVARGLIYREPIPGDRRRALLKLSDSGRELFEAAYPLLAGLSRTMLDELTAQEVHALDTIMRKLSDAADHLSAQQPVPERADRRKGGTRRSRGDRHGSA